MITIDRTFLDEDGAPDGELLLTLLDWHDGQRVRLGWLRDMYDRHHAIEARRRLRGLPNNRLVHDLPGYITAIAAGYLVGEPVTYSPPQEQAAAFKTIQEAYVVSSVESVDAELAVDASVYGRAVELCYADGESRPRVAQVSPLDCFVVYDDTVEHKPLFGVARREIRNRRMEREGEGVTVYTSGQAIYYRRVGREQPREEARRAHYFGGVPMVEYWNNAREQGDFEGVASLIDAYDTLQSDRMNDKQQFTDAVFVLKGVGALGVNDTEEVGAAEDAAEGEHGEPQTATAEQKAATDPSVRLRQTRTLFLPGDGADAQFVTKPDAESGNEVLRRSLNSDIHKLSMVPALTDEEFSGVASGVSLRYKLLGLEQLTKVKERWFREGLRARLRLFAAFLAKKGAPGVDVDKVQIAFTRSLPVNDLEIAQTVATYQGMVPSELLLAQVPFVEDAEEAQRMLEKERAEAQKRQMEAFDARAFREQEEEDDEE